LKNIVYFWESGTENDYVDSINVVNNRRIEVSLKNDSNSSHSDYRLSVTGMKTPFYNTDSHLPNPPLIWITENTTTKIPSYITNLGYFDFYDNLTHFAYRDASTKKLLTWY